MQNSDPNFVFLAPENNDNSLGPYYRGEVRNFCAKRKSILMLLISCQSDFFKIFDIVRKFGSRCKTMVENLCSHAPENNDTQYYFTSKCCSVKQDENRGQNTIFMSYLAYPQTYIKISYGPLLLSFLVRATVSCFMDTKCQSCLFLLLIPVLIS